jgi:hypothetical protein
MKKISKNVKTILDVLQNEVDGDVKSALKKITKNYSMTWGYKGKKELFPKNAQGGIIAIPNFLICI